MENKGQNTSDMYKLNEKMVNLILTLQKELKLIKEDVLVNSQHISNLKNKSTSALSVLNEAVSSHVENTGEMIENIILGQDDNKETSYSNFLKTLLLEDFQKKQKEILENIRREVGNPIKKTTNKKANSTSNNFLIILSLIFSLSSLSLLLFICFKFNIFGQLF
ncbi:hypothetical protein FPD46_07925 [Campylobacter peloridis]|uniref:Transmembrane protein n=1 Tax=Campylobacter peloridis TaxID=488546 RepID=A0A5C7DXN6_9BACT|nr:hypothetical protein [Campylobacter peloridis]TXE78484.1 hypothetical protein FPD46_07925 [Campylobacter peloridis]